MGGADQRSSRRKRCHHTGFHGLLPLVPLSRRRALKPDFGMGPRFKTVRLITDEVIEERNEGVAKAARLVQIVTAVRLDQPDLLRIHGVLIVAIARGHRFVLKRGHR